MIYYVWDYLDYVRASQSGFSEYQSVTRKVFGGEFPKCPHCGARIGMLQWQPPYKVRFTTSKVGDLVTDGLDILVSDRFRDAWETAGLKGLTFSDVEVIPKRASRSTVPAAVHYQLIHIQNTITRLDPIQSGLVVNEMVGCSECCVASRKRVERLRLDETTVPDLDVFRPSGLYGIVVVTEAVINLIEREHLTNFHFVHQDDYREPKVFATHERIL